MLANQTDEKPLIHRKLVYTDLEGNHNKEWHVYLWANGDIETRWGRVGDPLQAKRKPGNGAGQLEVNALVNEKRGKGYQELYMAGGPQGQVPGTANKSLALNYSDPVEALAAEILRAANENIVSYLNVDVDALGPISLGQARDMLNNIIRQKDTLKPYEKRNLVTLFYKMIPTKLPRKIDPDDVVSEFFRNLNKQEQRLDQLDAALLSLDTQQHGGSVVAQLGGVELKPLAQSSTAYGLIMDQIQKTGGKHREVENIFAVHLPHERQAFEKETRGKHNVRTMFHGTAAPNVRHIVRTGLIVPKTAANGRRCGPGIYFADRFERSRGYTDTYGKKWMFVTSVAVGNSFTTQSTYSGSDAPPGYDSVHGTGTWSSLGDEWVVYHTSQQTLRAILVLK